MATTTYRAVQVSKPGRLEVVEREVTAPPPGKVRIRVEACGVCHSDALTVEGLIPDIRFPRVPGHEVVGKIDALGEVLGRGPAAHSAAHYTSDYREFDGIMVPTRRRVHPVDADGNVAEEPFLVTIDLDSVVFS